MSFCAHCNLYLLGAQPTWGQLGRVGRRIYVRSDVPRGALASKATVLDSTCSHRRYFDS
jgi:hypothetical protein